MADLESLESRLLFKLTLSSKQLSDETFLVTAGNSRLTLRTCSSLTLTFSSCRSVAARNFIFGGFSARRLFLLLFGDSGFTVISSVRLMLGGDGILACFRPIFYTFRLHFTKMNEAGKCVSGIFFTRKKTSKRLNKGGNDHTRDDPSTDIQSKSVITLDFVANWNYVECNNMSVITA